MIAISRLASWRHRFAVGSLPLPPLFFQTFQILHGFKPAGVAAMPRPRKLAIKFMEIDS